MFPRRYFTGSYCPAAYFPQSQGTSPVFRRINLVGSFTLNRNLTGTYTPNRNLTGN